MVGRPLPQQLRRRPRILDLVGRGAGEMVRGDVADAVAAGLDRVHLDVGQRVEDVRHVAQLRPVELDVLPRGEVAVALVPALGDHRELAQLARVQRAVGDRDPQHVGVELQVEPVPQPQRQELRLGQRAGDAPLHLVAELGDALAHEVPVEIGIVIHRQRSAWRPCWG